MSEAARTVCAMTNRTMSLESDPAAGTAPARAVDERCPRCDSHAVHVILYGPLDLAVEAAADPDTGLDGFTFDDAPIFDCRECGFEWGLAVRELLG